ncbi:MAG: hypothetical protein ACLQBX_10235 [Candidatus Limnocylindrales bacterium]
MIRRILAFILGDMIAAEDLQYPKFDTPTIVVRARADAKLAEYLVGVAEKSRDQSSAALDGIQARASSFMTVVIGLVPLSLAAVALASPPADAGALRWAGFGFVVLSTVALLVAAAAAALATGMGLTALQNLAFLEKDGTPMTEAELRADEAETWNYAAQLNMETCRRRATELFQARRWAVIALASALIGLALVFMPVGGQHASLLQVPTPTPSLSYPTPSS